MRTNIVDLCILKYHDPWVIYMWVPITLINVYVSTIIVALCIREYHYRCFMYTWVPFIVDLCIREYHYHWFTHTWVPLSLIYAYMSTIIINLCIPGLLAPKLPGLLAPKLHTPFLFIAFVWRLDPHIMTLVIMAVTNHR